ncbi:MAG TPA: patatin-like phospholipase family protein [Terracidiphilus sp.]|nr:patatin-like phospholipase family protein [Terracidiphilus sp.]
MPHARIQRAPDSDHRPALPPLIRAFATCLIAASFLVSPLSSSGLQDSSAQASPPASQPRIGIVLEGGAALGLAHIGVLKWFEEHHIPVRYVAGTSMGGLVGGLYATGNSPAEMKQLVQGIDWDVLLNGKVPFPDLAYRRKEDTITYPNGLEFGLKHGVSFPEGLNSGHFVGLVFDRIALPYSFTPSFNDLPIPFACVATDLVSGKAHVFHDGSLAMALRSTMALPAIFSPVRTGSAIYVDGGLLDNLPVDVAKEMGADVVIAIHLETKATEPTEQLASVGVLGKSIDVVIAANELRSMQNADVLVTVPVAKFSGTDYKRSEELIKTGYDAAEAKAAVLSRFSVDDATWNQYKADRDSRRKTMPSPQFVDVTGTSHRLEKDLETRLTRDVGKPVDPDKLDKELTNMMGHGRFERVGYRGAERDHQQGLDVFADEKTYAPPTVLPIVVIDGSEYYRVQFTVGARITMIDLGGFGGELRNDLTVGSNTGIRSSYYRPLGSQLHWFFEPGGYAANIQQSYYKGTTLTAEYRKREYGGTFDLGYNWGKRAELRAGYQTGHEKFSPNVGAAEFGTLEGRVGASSLQYNFIGQDDIVIPHKGFDLHLEQDWYDADPGATEHYPVAEVQSGFFIPLSPPSTLYLSGGGGSTFAFYHTGVPAFSLGGKQSIIAYGENEILTDQYMLYRAGYIRNLWKLPPIVGDKIYAFGVGEFAKADYFNAPSHYPADGVAALVIRTILGPIMIGGTYGTSGHAKFFYQVGRIF